MALTADHIASLYDQHGPDILRYLARRTFDPETAVDLLADTFTKAIASRRRFRGTSTEEAIGWLYAIARSQLSDHRRRARAERAAMSRVQGERRALYDEEYERIEQLLDLQDIRDTVAAALDELPDTHRQVIRLRVVEERSYDELAALLGTSVVAARVRLSRALRALRDAPSIIELREELRHA